MIVPLAACSSQSSSSSGASANVTLKLVQSGDASQGGAFQTLADKYKKETGVTVEIVEVPSDDLATRLRNNAQANDLPDLAAAPAVDPVWKLSLIHIDAADEE